MKERIIVASGISGNELLKNMAIHGLNCINFRVCLPAEFARLALLRSGITIRDTLIDKNQENALIARSIQGENYFGKITYPDVLQISDAVRRMRGLVTSNDELGDLKARLSKGIFKEKNETLLSVYQKYQNTLLSNHYMDSISLIRYALEKAGKMDADFICLKEFPLSPLENALIQKLSDGKVSEISIIELFQIENPKVHVKSYKKCYGAPNEVETILTDIYSSKKLDQCTVAITDPSTYAQIFLDYALLYNIPVTFGCGIPIGNSNPAKLLILYYNWITGGFYGATALEAMLRCEAFSMKTVYEQFPEETKGMKLSVFFSMLEDIRFTDQADINKVRMENLKKALAESEAEITPEDKKAWKLLLDKKACLPALEVMSEELSLPIEEFISKYSYIRKGSKTCSQELLMQVDLAAMTAIYNELCIIRQTGIHQTADDIIKNVLKKGVLGQRSEAGALHITTIDKSCTSIRKNIYICGLSASKFPGSPTENYLLLDKDLELFEDTENLTSNGRVFRKKEQLLSLVKLSTGLKSDIYVSYAGLNVSELKKENASSLIFELLKEEAGKTITTKELENVVIQVEYFEPAISNTREIGKAYNKGDKIQLNDDIYAPESISVSGDLEKAYSPSALKNFFDCPKKFLLCNIMGIQTPDIEDPFVVINAADNGTLAHSMMEHLANSPMSKEEFLAVCDNAFDRFLLEHTPLINVNAEAAKEKFLDMMEVAYNTDLHRPVELKEEDIYSTHESGVKIHGFPDRVEKLEDGTYLVVDYKTGGTIKHVPDDVDTCLQVLIYAYILEHPEEKDGKKREPINVSSCEFRYIQLGQTVSCKYDDEIKAKLKEKMDIFRLALKEGEFECAQTDDPCEYCEYAGICGKF